MYSFLGSAITRNGVLRACVFCLGLWKGACDTRRCFDPTWVNSTASNGSCPSNCQAVAVCKNKAEVCVRPQDCAVLFKGGDYYSGAQSCVDCQVGGCGRCANSTSCAECTPNFELTSDGKCDWKYFFNYLLFVWFCLALLVWVLIDFGVAACLNNTASNPDALNFGLDSRWMALVCDRSQKEKAGYFPRYPLSTNVHTEPLLGLGLPLFFNWFVLLLCVSLWLTFISFLFRSTGTDTRMTDPCSEVYLQPDGRLGVKRMSTWAFFSTTSGTWALLAYCGSTLLSFIFFCFQRRCWEQLKHKTENSPRLCCYTIEAHGFPERPVAAADRKKLQAWWQEQVCEVAAEMSLDLQREELEVVEVSIAYNISDPKTKSDVDEQIARHLREKEDATELHRSDSRLEYEHHECCCTFHVPSKQFNAQVDASDEDVEDSEDTSCKRTFWTQCLGWIMFGTDFKTCGCHFSGWDSQMGSQDEIQSPRELDLQQLVGSGYMIVVLQTQKAATMMKQYPEPLLWSDGDVDHEITIRPNFSDPTEVQWGNYGIPNDQLWWQIFSGFLLIAIVLGVWTAMYFPWAYFSLSAASGANGLTQRASDLILSALIGLGNCLVAYACALVCDRYGFRHTHNKRQVYLVICIPAVALNVIVDIACTIGVAYYEEYARFDTNKVNGVQFFYAFGMDIFFDAMFALLVPMYISFSYLVEPVGTLLMPFWVGVWRISGDKQVTKAQAARILQAPDIDIVNPPYADIICTTTAFCVTLVVPNSQHWLLFLWLVFFCVLLYCQNRFRILRWHTTTFYGTEFLCRIESYLWALPLGVLAAAVGFHCVAPRFPHRQVMAALCFFGHVAIHCVVTRLIYGDPHAPSASESDAKPYTDVLENRVMAATYRTTNPVEVLASHQNFERNPLTFYQIGDEHLQLGDKYKDHEASSTGDEDESAAE